MLRIKTIVHPTDFSSYAVAAFKHALYWARLFGAELHLLHTLPAIGVCEIDEITEASRPGIAHDATRTQHVQQMRQLVDAAQTDDVPVRYFLAHGPDPGTAILTHAQAVSADLIMMGTRGLGQAEAPCLGSIAASVMQHAMCPVLFVQHPEQDVRSGLPVGRILVYIDLTQQTCALLEWAGALAAHFQAHLDLLYVAQTTSPDSSSVSAAINEAGRLETRVKERLLQLCTKAHDLEEIASAHALQVTFHVRTGYPADALSSFAQEHVSDLLMMVVPCLSSTEYAPLETKAQHIVHQVPCPVLTVNPPGTPLVKQTLDEQARSAAASGLEVPAVARASVDAAPA